MFHRTISRSFIALAALAPGPAQAAAALDGATLGWFWALPFIGILLTIAAGPLLFARAWHRHYGKLAFAWSALTLIPLAAVYGAPTAAAAFTHAMLAEYLSFIVLLFALYVVAGGILVRTELRGTPLLNTAMLAFGTLIASVVGTTGAAMILIRPLIRANAARLHNVHVVVFFMFLVANIGGALSPLAIRRCSSVSCAASTSSGRRASCGSKPRSSPPSCSQSSSRSTSGTTARTASSRPSAKASGRCTSASAAASISF